MEERYEIRAKIGQGGLGAIYRAYDTRMSREVAIKRISVVNNDASLQEESTRQLIKEAGALASLQHPHIVTIYDVGSDEDGPYVVMELISGKTLDELIERAPLTWPDFRELAIQTLEALIAAQELGLIHSDIKPSNLMLTWLPSGKFQMKIVDFGLATLNQSQSLEELQEIEAVFGSIFFMAPEQFERVPLDARVDIYAMGCVYYQALTGTYPFRGETGNEVMIAHLHHKVIPIQDVRADIPIWACDWIMWMINRMPADRPESARDALHIFLQNDKSPNPAMSLGKIKLAIPGAPRSRTVRPNSVPPLIESGPVTTAQAPEVRTAPQPLIPPEGSKPSIYTAPIEIPQELPPAPTVSGTLPPTKKHAPLTKKKDPNKNRKITISAVAFIILGVLSFLLVTRIKASKASQRFDDMINQAGLVGTTEIPMTSSELNHFLEVAGNADTEEKQTAIFAVLAIAKPSDGSSFDSSLTGFATTGTQLLPETRAVMIRDVLGKRVTNAMVPPLIDFARSTNDNASAVAALQAILKAVGDDQYDPLLSLRLHHPNHDIRRAAENAILEILRKTSRRPEFIKQLDSAIKSSTDSRIKENLWYLKMGKNQ